MEEEGEIQQVFRRNRGVLALGCAQMCLGAASANPPECGCESNAEASA